MHTTCYDTIPHLPVAGCSEVEKFRFYAAQLEHLLAGTSPELLEAPGAHLVCDSDEEASYMRLLLDRKGMTHIEARVKVKRAPLSRGAKRAARQQAGYKARR